jgi:hypothetical protein
MLQSWIKSTWAGCAVCKAILAAQPKLDGHLFCKEPVSLESPTGLRVGARCPQISSTEDQRSTVTG